MSAIFCCSSIKPYRPQRLDHEEKFEKFIGSTVLTATTPTNDSSLASRAPYAVQLVKQVNYGPQEFIKYFVPNTNSSNFTEVSEDSLLRENFHKLNTYKNFRCEVHNNFFEINLYQRNPVIAHHWRANLARPSRDIDLAYRQKGAGAEKATKPTADPTVKNISVQEPGSSLFIDHRSTKTPADNHEKQSIIQLLADCSARLSPLKEVLRFLLPTAKESLGSNPLLSLFSLEWVNKEVDLGLDFAELWEVKLNKTTVFRFFAEFELSDGDLTSSGEIEGLAAAAIHHDESLKGQKLPGGVRLQKIVSYALQSGVSKNWASRHGANINHAFASGPGRQTLEHCRRRDNAQQLELVGRHSEEIPVSRLAKAESWSDNDENGRARNFDPYYDHEPTRDYTACDQECGYCGDCDY